MYTFLLSNTEPNPGNGGSKGGGNAMSPNMNFANVADMGPNGKNTLNAATAGARYGLDPRETTMWTDDAGKTWKFGAEVGWYDNDNGLGKSWVGGYRIAGGANVPHGWTYMNWPDDSKATVTFTAATALNLTKAGGASSSSVGIVTVKDLTSGASSKTASLGTGVASGALGTPLKVAAGDKYSVTSSGSVGVGSSTWWADIFKLGGYTSDCSSCSNPTYRPMLFVQ